MEFRGNLDFLSNNFPAIIVDDYGLVYSCVEAAYQAHKTSDKNERRAFTRLSGPAAHKAGRKMNMTDAEGWKAKRLEVMKALLEQKFSDSELAARLMDIQGDIVAENNQKEKYWGVCKGKGENHLGILLMEIRDKLVAEKVAEVTEQIAQPEATPNSACGKIVITSIKNLEMANQNTPLTEAWFVVRSLTSLGGNLPNVGNAKSYWVHQLSPSDGLFATYWSMKKQGAWNHETFTKVYVPQFLEEMRTDFAKGYLNLLYHSVVDEGKNIALVCFCKEEAECHRSILAGLMMGAKVDVVDEYGKKARLDYYEYHCQYRGIPVVHAGETAPIQEQTPVQPVVVDTSASMVENLPDVKPTFALLVAGSRTFHDAIAMENVLNNLLSAKAQTHNIIIVEGAARGADSLAREYAKNHGYDVKEFPAQWMVDGKRDRAAGFKRNRLMHEFLKDYEARGCVCFWDGVSPGTSDNFKLCKEFNTPLRVYDFVNQTYVD